eukprot:Clim_evm52s157 gene=Clim_evmTU52s157
MLRVLRASRSVSVGGIRMTPMRSFQTSAVTYRRPVYGQEYRLWKIPKPREKELQKDLTPAHLKWTALDWPMEDPEWSETGQPPEWWFQNMAEHKARILAELDVVPPEQLGIDTVAMLRLKRMFEREEYIKMPWFRVGHILGIKYKESFSDSKFTIKIGLCIDNRVADLNSRFTIRLAEEQTCMEYSFFKYSPLIEEIKILGYRPNDAGEQWLEVRDMGKDFVTFPQGGFEDRQSSGVVIDDYMPEIDEIKAQLQGTPEMREKYHREFMWRRFVRDNRHSQWPSPDAELVSSDQIDIDRVIDKLTDPSRLWGRALKVEKRKARKIRLEQAERGRLASRARRLRRELKKLGVETAKG